MKKEYLERIYAGWLAKIIGIRYGAPVEGWTYEKIKNPNSKISKRCCDFKLLENKCREYIKRSEKL